MKEQIKSFINDTIQKLPVKKNESSLEITIKDKKIVLEFAEKECILTFGNYQKTISYDLGADKFFTAQKGLFKNLEPLMKDMEDKKAFGQMLSTWKNNVELLLEEKEMAKRKEALAQKLAIGYPEPSLGNNDLDVGYEHFLNKVRDEMLSVFRSMGYTLVEERALKFVL